MSKIQSIILLGPSGFIGSKVLELVRLRKELSKNTFVVSTPRSDVIKKLPSLTFQNVENAQEKLQVYDLFERVYVINCAAHRTPKQDIQNKYGNYTYPIKILNNLLVSKKHVTWYQLESYWQFCQGDTPLPEYVFWKNRFRFEAQNRATTSNLSFVSLVLPHVIGVNDDKKRYLNRNFLSLISHKDILITNPDNKFYLCDNDDVSQYLIQQAFGEQFVDKSRSNLFQYHEISLIDLFTLFKDISKSTSKFTVNFNESHLNPILDTGLQSPLIPIGEFKSKNLDVTLYNILEWLRN